MLKQLKNLRKKWRCEATKQYKFAYKMFDKNAIASAEKSMGIWIGFNQAANELDKVIKEMESANV